MPNNSVQFALIATVLFGSSDTARAQTIYWTDPVRSKIQFADLDGSGVEDLVTKRLSRPGEIALDLRMEKMYWADVGKIQCSNLDGSEVRDLVDDGRPQVAIRMRR